MHGGLGRIREPGWVLVVMEDAMGRMALFRLLEWAGGPPWSIREERP
jgi:hypothetical protein